MNIYYKDKYVRLIHGDCLKVMDKMIEQNIKVDMILTDPPYGTTQCKWDSVIPFDEMWKRLEILIKDNGSVVMFSSQPFTSVLIGSNLKLFKYEWIWEKSTVSGAFDAKNKPMKKHENIIVFSKANIPTNSKNKMIYYPQGLKEINKVCKNDKSFRANFGGNRPGLKDEYIQNQTGYPISILRFRNDKGLHPTQKPVSLCEYLIKTYTLENEIILDFTCGSGTTLVAAKNLNRKCYGIELEEKYCEVTKNRLLQNVS